MMPAGSFGPAARIAGLPHANPAKGCSARSRSPSEVLRLGSSADVSLNRKRAPFRLQPPHFSAAALLEL